MIVFSKESSLIMTKVPFAIKTNINARLTFNTNTNLIEVHLKKRHSDVTISVVSQTQPPGLCVYKKCSDINIKGRPGKVKL